MHAGTLSATSRGVTCLLLMTLQSHLTSPLDIEFCKENLGLKDGRIPDSALKASSSFDSASVGPQNARLHSDSGGGAWCPKRAISPDIIDEEYLEIDLGSLTVITGILSQGRFGNGRGQEYAEAYKIHYTRFGMTDFKEYRDNLGRTILPGNVNTYNVANNTLLPSIFADRIRLFPYSEHTRTVCMRVELQGCVFSEGVLAYSIPQGMVRGSVLELMDHTYDGQEDSLTGELSGGLGQLVDGRYGSDNFKTGGHMKGYNWIGWKRREESSFNMMFNFDRMRTFHSVDIHANNHFTKDISVFSKAKIYFSNEEGKFADDRVVDFKYMPDVVLENARNVSINLKGEHGQYVMIQLTFDKKWILISEVTFHSEPRAQILFTEPPPQVYDDIHIHRHHNGGDFHRETDGPRNNNHSPPPSNNNEPSSDQAGILIGTLVTFIAILLAGIAYVSYRNSRQTSDKTTPTHHPILSYKFADHFFGESRDRRGQRAGGNGHGGSNSNNKMFFPSHQHLHQRIIETPPIRQETIYEEPSALYSAAGFLSLNRKYSTADPLSEDVSDDYAEPNVLLTPEKKTNYATPTPRTQRPEDNSSSRAKPASLPISHYSRPLSPPNLKGGTISPPSSSTSTIQAHKSSPLSSSSRFSPPGHLSATIATAGGRYSGGELGSSSSTTNKEIMPSSRRRKSSSSLINSVNNNVCNSLLDNLPPPVQRGAGIAKFISPTSTTTSNATVTEDESLLLADNNSSFTASRFNIPPDLSKQLYDNNNDASLLLGSNTMSPRPEISVDTLNVELNEIQRSELFILEKLGEGQFGEIHLCKWKEELVAVKSLKGGCDTSTRSDFEHEARILTTLTDPNLVRVLGVSFKDDVYCMICEYTERGDLYQFLQDHVAETTLSKSPGVPTLSYGCLIYLAAQIASGMKYLESLNFVHRDLATRNVLVDVSVCGIILKISDFGMSRSMYKNDYYKSQAGCLLPIRWMAWESVLMGKFTTKSDVWSFAVTLWEILTFAREQPFESFNDDKVIASLSSVYQHGLPLAHLPTPIGCPREVSDLMTECWQREEGERPSFQEIHLFLMRKNLGYSPASDISFLNSTQNNNEINFS